MQNLFNSIYLNTMQLQNTIQTQLQWGQSFSQKNLPDLSHIVANIGNAVPAFFLVVRGLCGAMAIFFVIHACMQFYKMSQNYTQQGSPMGPVVELIVAGLLSSLSMDNHVQSIVANIVTSTNFQMPQQFSMMGSSGFEMQGLHSALGAAIINIMFLMGTVAIVRGLILLKRLSYGDTKHHLSSVFTYIISGAFALNIETMVGIFDTSIGTHFSDVLFG